MDINPTSTLVLSLVVVLQCSFNAVSNWETSWLFERGLHKVGFITCKAEFTVGAESGL